MQRSIYPIVCTHYKQTSINLQLTQFIPQALQLFSGTQPPVPSHKSTYPISLVHYLQTVAVKHRSQFINPQVLQLFVSKQLEAPLQISI